MFDKWCQEVSSRIRELTNGKTFNLLSPSVINLLERWYAEYLSVDQAAERYIRMTQKD